MSWFERSTSRLPHLGSRWWTVVLGLSLMANLLIGGIVIGRNLGDRHGGGPMLNNVSQLVPRKFIDNLSDVRRKDILGILRTNRDELRNLREDTRATVLKLAEALEAPDPAGINAVIDSYTTGSESLAGHSAKMARDLIAKLTADERKLLASAIRDRNSRRMK